MSRTFVSYKFDPPQQRDYNPQGANAGGEQYRPQGSGTLRKVSERWAAAGTVLHRSSLSYDIIFCGWSGLGYASCLEDLDAASNSPWPVVLPIQLLFVAHMRPLPTERTQYAICSIKQLRQQGLHLQVWP